MTDPVQAFLQSSGLQAQSFPPNSRYSGSGTLQITRADGTRLVYLERRFVPQPESLTLLQAHEVVSGDRLDNLAARYVGDPELYWRICDANRALRPDELIEVVGRRLRITLPPAASGAASA